MELQELLDDRRLEGLHGVERRLGPKRPALAINSDDLSDATAAIEHACQLWAGASYPLLPATAGHIPLSSRWQAFLDRCLIDQLWHRDISETFSYRGSDRRITPHELGEFVVAVLDAAPTKRDQWMPVALARLPQDHDWFVAYATALGIWPDAPDAHLVERYQYRKGLRWEDVLNVRREEVAAPGPADLLQRLRVHNSTTPAMMSMALLGISRAARSGSIQGPPLLPNPNEIAQQIGPNIVVVYEPGSVEDLALIWNLRMANGLPDGLPLGIPATADVGSALKHWQDEFAFQMWTLGHDRCAITSASIPLDTLRPIANVAGPLWSVVSPEEVLRDSDRATRRSLDIANFVDGEATVSGWDPADRDALGKRRSRMHDFVGIARFGLRDKRIPPSRSLEPEYSFAAGFRGGGFEFPESRSDSLTSIRWPSGWMVVEALALDRGLRAQRSSAGLAAAALLEQVGSIASLSALRSERLADLLYRLSERSGMTWFRRKLREMGAAMEKEDQRLLKEAIADLHFSATNDEQQETTFSALVQMLGREGGEAWLSWAEERELLIRGARVHCGHCGARSWRTIEELGPAPVCRGCGREISSPYPPGELPFAYRASQAVLQAMEHDALVQLLAMRWFAELFRPFMDKPSRLFGAYPGVEFFEKGETNPIGEADLLLVQSDGEFVIGECKRRGAGLNPVEMEKLERLAERLGCPWTFLATLDRAMDCPPIWREAARALPSKPRFALTAEFLFDSDVSWPAGADIFAWREEPASFHEKREREFADRLGLWVDRLGRRRTIEEEELRERSEQWSSGVADQEDPSS
ncbi:MAG: hypothetical protein ACTHLH_09935 [Solirubrobacterales bacterium]